MLFHPSKAHAREVCGPAGLDDWFRGRTGTWLALVVGASALLISGCAPRFPYKPRHDAVYESRPPLRGVQIERGDVDGPDRPEGDIDWSRTDARIVADALADELKHSRLFERVKVVKKADLAKIQARYSHLVRFRIHRFGVHPEEGAFQKAGRMALKYMGPQGYFTSKGIPRKWIVEAEIEFTLHTLGDRPSGSRAFSKTYRATPRSVTVSGYAGTDKQGREASAALEEVVKAFVQDVAGQIGP